MSNINILIFTATKELSDVIFNSWVYSIDIQESNLSRVYSIDIQESNLSSVYSIDIQESNLSRVYRFKCFEINIFLHSA